MMTDREMVEMSIKITSAVSEHLVEGAYTDVLTKVNRVLVEEKDYKCTPTRMRDRAGELQEDEIDYRTRIE